MQAAFGRLHNGGPAAFGRRPTVVDSIMVDGEPANIAKTYANVYQMFADLYILPISSYSPSIAPGAIQLAESTALHWANWAQFGFI